MIYSVLHVYLFHKLNKEIPILTFYKSHKYFDKKIQYIIRPVNYSVDLYLQMQSNKDKNTYFTFRRKSIVVKTQTF